MKKLRPLLRLGLRWSFVSLAIFAISWLPLNVRAQALTVSVFAPGSVSLPEGNVFRGSFAPNGRTFYFFRRVGERGEDYRIYFVEATPTGWGAQRLVLGADGHSDLYPTVSPDGRTLVFASYRPFPDTAVEATNANLWMVRREAEHWGVPQPLVTISTPANYDAGPWFDAEGGLHFTTTSPDWSTTQFQLSVPVGSDFSPPRSDTMQTRWATWRGDLHVWNTIASPDTSVLILEVSALRDDGRPGPADLWAATWSGDDWNEPVRLGSSVNTDLNENFAVFTPVGDRLLFVRDFTTYYVVSAEEVRMFATPRRE